MNAIMKNPKFALYGAATAALLIYLLKKKLTAGDQGMLWGVGSDVGAGAVNLLDGAVSGAVYEIGDSVGIPQTSETECEKALREGRTWDASFACPAGDFISGAWGSIWN